MKKEDIYRLIEYNGVYDDQVKRNLKKLIKKYHPDKRQGDRKIIEIIYEVKKELENNKVSYNTKKEEEKKENISSEEALNYHKQIIELEYEKNYLRGKIKEKYGLLSEKLDEYSKLYQKYCKNRVLICEYDDKKVDENKRAPYEIIFYLLLVIMFVIYFLNHKSIYLIIAFILLGIVIFMFIRRLFKTNSFNDEINRYQKIEDKYDERIKDISRIIDGINQDIRELERKITKIDNDIRFYSNRLKK